MTPSRPAKGLFRIMDRMITGELARTLASVLLIVVLIVVSNRFLKILNKAIEGDVSGDAILIVVGLKLISVGIDAFPAALFAAILMVLGRMYRDNEITALAVGQIGPVHIYRALMILVAPLTVLMLVLSIGVLPWAEQEAQKMLHEAEKTAELQGVSAGRFNEYSHGDLVFYIEDITQDRQMRNIFVQHRQEDKLGITISDTARLEHDEYGTRYITLTNGRRYEGEINQGNYTLSEFKEYGLRVRERDDTPIVAEIEAKPSHALWDSDRPEDIAELQQRLSVPIGSLLLCFLAVPLANTAPRSGVYGNLLIAFLVFLIYNNLLNVAQSCIIKGTLPAWLGFSWVYALMFLCGTVLLAKTLGYQWFFRQLKNRFRT